jgi:cytochrome c-type biogenesis protein CcmE
MDVSYDGIVPDLFGPRTFVVVEGAVERSADGTPHLLADSVIIKHESEFVTDPADASIAE